MVKLTYPPGVAGSARSTLHPRRAFARDFITPDRAVFRRSHFARRSPVELAPNYKTKRSVRLVYFIEIFFGVRKERNRRHAANQFRK